MDLPKELVLIIVKEAGHRAFESSVKCCKSWRSWIKEDIKKNRQDWARLFNKALCWIEEKQHYALPGDVLHGIYVHPPGEWEINTNYYRGLRHGAMIVREKMKNQFYKYTKYIWKFGELQSSSQRIVNLGFLQLLNSMSEIRYSN
nr:hypothetical protein K-LCC10_0162 [Kaumoebavirus]